MRSKLSGITALALMLVLLGACASSKPATGSAAAAAAPAAAAPAASSGSGTPAQQQALARYQAYAGPPIPSFTWLGQFWSWESLSKDQLVVYTTTSDAYLLKVWPPCDLRFVINRIGLSSTARTVYARMDSVVVSSGPGGPLRCPIEDIRRIDLQRMKADQRQQAAPKPGTPGTPSPAPGTPDTPPPAPGGSPNPAGPTQTQR